MKSRVVRIFLVAFMAMACGGFWGFYQAEAKDVWVYTVPDSEFGAGYEVYVDDESISGVIERSDEGHVQGISKQVRDGKVLKIIKWDFIRIQNEFWRYHNTAMDDDHLTVVMPESESYYVLEFCGKKIGFPLVIEDLWVY